MYRVNYENQLKIKILLKKYSNLFQNETLKKILASNEIDKTKFEILTLLEAIDQSINPYIEFASYLQQVISNVNKKRIIEYESGYIPGLSIACSKTIELEKNIIAYGHHALPISYKKIILTTKKEAIKNKKMDVLISFLIREKLEEAIHFAMDQNMEFVIQSYPQKGETTEDHFKYLIQLKRELQKNHSELESNLVFTNFSRQISSPLIIARKKAKENDL